MCLSRLGRLPSSYLLLAICRSRVFWQSLFCLSRLNTAVRSLGRSSVRLLFEVVCVCLRVRACE